MPRGGKQQEALEATRWVSETLSTFDFQIDPDDFVFYELSRLIDEEKASFETEEFRRLVDEGIRTHVEDRPPIRAALAGILRTGSSRMPPPVQSIAARVIHVVEDDAADLTNAGALVMAYMAFLFEHLPAGNNEDLASEQSCRAAIDQWKAGAGRDETAEFLKSRGRAAIGPVADLLFGSTEDRVAAQLAIEVLAAIPSPITARVLAHAISEPLLDEDVETAAYQVLKSFWPLARNYVLYHLRGHNHEDIPVLWYQLCVEVDEPHTVDLALEELRAHGEVAEFHEDLTALVHVLACCRDPEMQDKILAAVNQPDDTGFVRTILATLLQQQTLPDPSAEPWAGRRRSRLLTQSYRRAAALYDSGKRSESAVILEQILATEPGHPFAVMLHGLIESDP